LKSSKIRHLFDSLEEPSWPKQHPQHPQPQKQRPKP
jgi:hypothetical protein